MNWEAIGAISEIVGAAAVVVTLAYLALQMRQNTKQLRIESHRALYSDYRQIVHDLRSDLEAQWPNISEAFNDWPSASPKSQALAHLFLAEIFLHLLSARKMYEEGSIDLAAYMPFEDFNVGLFTYPGVQHWWAGIGEFILPRTLSEIISKRLQSGSFSNPALFRFYDHKNWKDA
jgi:hypothetical protein